MTTQPFNNNSSLAERQALLRQEHKLNEPATLFARARAGLDDTDVPGGRYAAQQAHFPGEGSYPAAAEWTRDGVGLEPPSGIDINALEPCGTFAEVQRSEFANSEPNPASQHQMIDDCVSGVGDPAPAGATPAGRATSSTAPARSSSPLARLPGDVATLDRLAELMAEGLVRPVVRRRKV